MSNNDDGIELGMEEMNAMDYVTKLLSTIQAYRTCLKRFYKNPYANISKEQFNILWDKVDFCNLITNFEFTDYYYDLYLASKYIYLWKFAKHHYVTNSEIKNICSNCGISFDRFKIVMDIEQDSAQYRQTYQEYLIDSKKGLNPFSISYDYEEYF